MWSCAYTILHTSRIHGHISPHDQTPRSVAQLSVSRTTRAHNRTRARSPPRSETPHTTPPLLSIHALHSASGAHTRQRPHRARTLHARTPHWRPLPFCTHACTCHLARARSSPRRERGTPQRGEQAQFAEPHSAATTDPSHRLTVNNHNVSERCCARALMRRPSPLIPSTA